MRRYGPFSLVLGDNEIPGLPGSTTATTALRFINYSPYTLLVTAAGMQPVIPAESTYRLDMPQSLQWDGTMEVVATKDLEIAGVTTSTILWIEGYGAGESMPMVDPMALTRTIGGSVAASTLVNTGGPGGTPVIITNSTGGGSNLVNNDGSRTTELISNGGNVVVEQLTPGGGPGHPASVVYGVPGNLTIAEFSGFLAQLQSDNGLLASDGFGDVTAASLSCTIPVGGIGNKVWLGLTDNHSGGTQWFWETDINGNLFLVNSSTKFLTAAPGVGGQVSFIIAPTLASGNQETSGAGFRGKAVTAGDIWAVWVNFRMEMTNIPSSVNLSGSTVVNCGASAANISKNGFFLIVTATAAGAFTWLGTYTTVGN